MAKTRSTWVVRRLGVAGYVFCTLQWMWLFVVIIPQLLSLAVVIPPPRNIAVDKQAQVLLTPFDSSIALVIVAATVILAVYAIAKLPIAVAKRGSDIIHEASTQFAPIFLRHRGLTKRSRMRLSRNLLFAVKLSATIIPFGGLLLVNEAATSMTGAVIIPFGFLLFVPTLAFFVAQRLLALWQGIDYRKLQ
ncbi:MAG: hypothetical protein WBB39_03795 [Candidatus Saccharimonadales bacterium]